MSNLGFHLLYHCIASINGIRVVRFFIERKSNLFSPESLGTSKSRRSPLRSSDLKDFDAIFFTVSFELDYLNIIRMLHISGVPPLKKDRNNKDPLIVVGGIAVSANPGPMSQFSDLIFMGDMEDSLESILVILKEHSFKKSKALFDEFGKIKGLFIPGVKEQGVERSIKSRIELPAHSVVITKATEFSNMFLVELIRGCKNSCKFCMVRSVNSPLRIINKNYIVDTVKIASNFTKRVGLIAPVLSDHDDLAEIVYSINDMGMKASFSSLRADYFTEAIAELIVKNDQKSITFAPETGSFKLRRNIGKILTDAAILKAVSIAIDFGIRHFRYYIMYGLPGEKEEDLIEICELVKKTVRLFKGDKYTLHLSINPFTPKSETAFRNEGILKIEDYIEKQRIIENCLSGLREVSFKFESLRLVSYHYYLSIGEKDIGLLLYNCYINNKMKDFKKEAERGLDGSIF